MFIAVNWIVFWKKKRRVVWYIGTSISKKHSFFCSEIGGDPQNVLIFSKNGMLCEGYAYLKTEM
jgi:hypothetical protein